LQKQFIDNSRELKYIRENKYTREGKMDFRAPTIAATIRQQVTKRFTEGLSNPEQGQQVLAELFEYLGNPTDGFPDWHPCLTAIKTTSSSSQLSARFPQIDHTVEFVAGFLTCPYNPKAADELVALANSTIGLEAKRLDTPLWADGTHPVVVRAWKIQLEADGTIPLRDAMRWHIALMAENAEDAQVAETWWTMQASVLGSPFGGRSSLFVNQTTGGHLRKSMEVLNDSGMFGPIYEYSLGMMPERQRDKIGQILVRTAIKVSGCTAGEFEFQLAGQSCVAKIKDTWDDGDEFMMKVKVGENDLNVTGFHYPSTNKFQSTEPTGKQKVAKIILGAGL
jgi:hypothetical protein